MAVHAATSPVVVKRLVDERPPDPACGSERVPYVAVAGAERIALRPCRTGLASGTGHPDLGACDVVSQPFAVPAGALFATAVALDEDAPGEATAPIELRASVLDGEREETIARTVLDPRDADRRWIEQRADLAAFGGRTVRLRLSARAAGNPAGAVALPVWADPRVLRPDELALGVILISLDTLRAISVSAYGSRRPTTPVLDARIGGAGVVFDNALAPWPHTRPSHMSAFTGLYPRTHGVLPEGAGLRGSIRTLPEILRAAGYETGAFTEDGFLDPRAGFRRGFATHVEYKSADLHEPRGLASTTFHDGLAWLADHRDGPFFLFLHTYEVHYPYTPPPPYDEAFEPIDAQGQEAARDLLRYEQEARSLDDQLGVFLDQLDALGLATRTLVVVMADHGEEFREHGMVRHGFQLWEESLRVPLMMRLPGVTRPGLRVATPTSLVDVAPTILDLLGLPPEPGLEGRSLLPLLLGQPAALHRAGVFFQTGIMYGLRTEECHCIIGLGRHRGATCFDVVDDPEQQVPLPEAHPCRARAWVEAEAFRRQSRLPLLDAGQPPPGLDGMDEDRKRKLRALGYL